MNELFSLAPDYVLCSKNTENRLVPEIIKAWRNFYTDNPLASESYCHMVNNRHFERVKKLINTDKLVHGGQTDANENYIAPTIMYVTIFFNFIYSQISIGQMLLEKMLLCKKKFSAHFFHLLL